ncbi:MAG: ATP-binding protein [Anaerolineales bacterium]|nr:ATP-binding protein [Anaerolineales bacterium]
MIQKPIANYVTEETLFREMVASDLEPNILFFQGESGSGKSHLIEHCINSVPDNPSVLIKLQSGSELVPTLFTRIGMRMGWGKLPIFTGMVAKLLEQPGQENNPLWQASMHRHLSEIGKLSDIESRFTRYQLLSDAWFADAGQFETPFLLAMDTYEKSSSLFDRWFSEEFLYGVANSGHMRVLVGGQRVPTLQESWGFSARLQDLKGIHNVEEWLVWAEKVGYQIALPENLATVIEALNGNPSQIIQFIKTQFPLATTPVKSQEPDYSQRRRFFENLTQFFSLSELKNICYFIGVDYENLPEHDQKNSFVRELLGYVGRIGRLQDLIKLCQQERPQLVW